MKQLFSPSLLTRPFRLLAGHGLLATLLLAGPLAFAQAPTITALSPTRNLRNAPVSSNVAVTFSQTMQITATTQGAVQVYSQQRGGRMGGSTRGTATVSGNTITFNPANDFKPGETLLVTTTAAARATNGVLLARGKVHQFTAATGGTGRANFQPGTATAVDIGPRIVLAGDVDGDGDLDLVTANVASSVINATNTVSVRLNGGDATGSNTGVFSNGSDFGINTNMTAAALGDVDGDLDLVTTHDFQNTIGFAKVHLNGVMPPAPTPASLATAPV